MKRQLIGPLIAGLATGFWAMPTGDGLMAQSFKRQVIGSVGTNHVDVGGVLISSTTGQPPSAGTIGSPPGFCLRQGFQQPVENLCGLQVSFEATPTTLPNNCGTTYVFEYTGSSVPGLEVSWGFGPNASLTSFDGLITPSISFAQPGVETVLLTISTGTCQANFSKSLQILAAPFSVVTAVADAKCYGDKGSATLTATGLNPPFQYLWDDAVTDPNRPDLQPGKYGWAVMDGKGCMMTGEAEVKGATEPLRIFPTAHSATCDTIADGFITLDIGGGVPPYTGHWSDDVDSLDHASLKAGTYGISVTDALGCEASKGVKVGELCKGPNLPDTFTPNGDGVNDSWEIPDLDRFPNMELHLFNRWGNVVYDQKGTYVAWNGMNNSGHTLPAAAYYYVIKLNDPTGIVWEGAVTIIR